jgi:hypothetical protein
MLPIGNIFTKYFAAKNSITYDYNQHQNFSSCTDNTISGSVAICLWFMQWKEKIKNFIGQKHVW